MARTRVVHMEHIGDFGRCGISGDATLIVSEATFLSSPALNRCKKCLRLVPPWEKLEVSQRAFEKRNIEFE